ncbi:hypothetical protein DLJ46_31430 [Micromonospora globispora]|uniref:Bacterial Ig-like domain-containing protein n=1 Tax=Micromonospora globispora TaxID=1450148 RepID=A0A317JRM8_9ACTN|nr:hypothetical protein [Micromonospora globispora]PWU43467.1 hypothetical protein DLJ46_31430 [Micromonospora globispora]
MRSRVRSALLLIVTAAAAVLVAPPNAQAVGVVPSHLTITPSSPSYVGHTITGKVALSFDDYADVTGSVIHMQRTFNGEVTPLPDIVATSWGDWFNDYPQAAGTYEYLATFDGDDVHAPAQATATVTVTRVPSHLNLSANNPSCAGCTISGTLALWFDDYVDATGSVIHMQRTFNGEVTPLPDIVLASSGNWFYDYPQAAGTYEYLATFDGDDVHAPAQATATVTVERRTSYVGMNVWANPQGTLHMYANLAGCHVNCELVVTAASDSRTWEVARFTLPEGGGYTPTISFKRQGATRVIASYAGDDWFLPAQAVATAPF